MSARVARSKESDPYNLGPLASGLHSIMAAISQKSEKQLSKTRFAGRFIGGKVAGVTAMSAFYGAVATFGTASTGTAISTLSGAAATNATLYWIGGLVGGGVAAGATVMTFGATAVGAGAMLWWSHKFGSKPRQLSELSLLEKRILCSCDILLRALEPEKGDAVTTSRRVPSRAERMLLSQDGVQPVIAAISSGLFSEGGQELLKKRLKRKYVKTLSAEYEKLIDWQKAFSRTFPRKPSRKAKSGNSGGSVLQRIWRIFSGEKEQEVDVQLTASGSVFGTFVSVINDSSSPLSVEQKLVLDAFRHSRTELNDATVEEISHYLNSLAADELKEATKVTSGHFRALLKTRNQLASEPAVEAGPEAFGEDVIFLCQGDEIEIFQPTASVSTDMIHEHLMLYPGVEVRASGSLESEKLIAIIEGLESREFKDYLLNQGVIHRLAELKSLGFITDISDELVSSAYVVAATTVHSIMVKKQSPPEALNDALVISGIIASGNAISNAIGDVLGLP